MSKFDAKKYDKHSDEFCNELYHKLIAPHLKALNVKYVPKPSKDMIGLIKCLLVLDGDIIHDYEKLPTDKKKVKELIKDIYEVSYLKSKKGGSIVEVKYGGGFFSALFKVVKFVAETAVEFVKDTVVETAVEFGTKLKDRFTTAGGLTKTITTIYEGFLLDGPVGAVFALGETLGQDLVESAVIGIGKAGTKAVAKVTNAIGDALSGDDDEDDGTIKPTEEDDKGIEQVEIVQKKEPKEEEAQVKKEEPTIIKEGSGTKKNNKADDIDKIMNNFLKIRQEASKNIKPPAKKTKKGKGSKAGGNILQGNIQELH